MNQSFKRNIVRVAIAVVFLLIIFFNWKVPILLKIENLNLPEGCENVYPAKVQISDVYWLHIKGEKVIKCDLGYEAVKEYVETHNSEFMRSGISIYPYAGMSDIAIYDSEFDVFF